MSIAPILDVEDETGPRGPYRKTAETQQRILDAAVRVFAEAGFEKGSLRAVAREAGLSQAGLLHHYPTKVALLSAVVQRRDDAALVQIETTQPGVHRLQALLDFARLSADSLDEVSLFAVLSAEASRESHPAHEYIKRRYEWTIDVAATTFQEVADQGQLEPDVSPRKASSMFMALWDGLQLQWLIDPSTVDVAGDLEIFLDHTLVAPLRDLLAATVSQ